MIAGKILLIIIGNWIATTPIPDQTIESRELRLEGKEKELFIAFLRKILRWLPEDRLTAEELYDDEFLNRVSEEG
jgi:hypothetical protein